MGLSRVVLSVAVVPATVFYALKDDLPVFVSCVILHVAATGFVIAFAATDFNADKTQRLLGKGEDGKIRLWGQLLFWPFHLGIRMRLLLKRRRSQEPLYHEISPGWYVGGWPTNKDSLPPRDPSIIDCTCEYPRTHQSSRYLCLLVWDTHGATAQQIKKAVDWAVLQKKDGHPIYIHCAHGHGRSVAILVACFLKLGISHSIEEAEAKVKSVRPKIRLNKRQKKHLRAWMELEQLTLSN